MTGTKRGALIVFEGCDRSGKSSQCSLLLSYLNNMNYKTELMRFPDRTSKIGTMIDQYLKSATDLDDHTIHLLFSSNRWEAR
jgi:dTMP kinase